MNYKAFIKDRNHRLQILRLLDFVPDKLMVQLQYRMKLGRNLNLKNPKRYSEKLQWYKLNYRNPDMTRCCEKYNVRSFVRERGLDEILNTCYGVFDSPDEIDIDSLPASFVIKDTLGGGGNSVILVSDKSCCDWNYLCSKMQSWVQTQINSKNPGREWPYENQKHRIIIEENLLKDEVEDLPDYKFFCFDGKPYCLYLMQNYTKHHEGGYWVF